MDLRTLRLAIATWEKGASWRDQGWAGENGDRSHRPCTHRKSHEATIHFHERTSKNRAPRSTPSENMQAMHHNRKSSSDEHPPLGGKNEQARKEHLICEIRDRVSRVLTSFQVLNIVSLV